MDALCDPNGDWGTIDRVMKDWEETNSPQVYWFQQLSDRLAASVSSRWKAPPNLNSLRNRHMRWKYLDLDTGTVSRQVSVLYFFLACR